MDEFAKTLKEALECIKADKRLSKEKDKNLEKLRKIFNIEQVWWDEVLKDMFLTPEFKKVSLVIITL